MAAARRRRGLSPADAAALRAAPRGALVRIVDEIAPEAAAASRGFKWGRPVKGAHVVTADVPPARLDIEFPIAAIEYRATKGLRGRSVGYRHEFDAPYPLLATAASSSSKRTRAGSVAPVPGLRPVTSIGPLLALEGPGGTHRLEFSGRSEHLAFDPLTKSLFVVRDAKRSNHVPLFIVRDRSRYTVTNAGIER